MPLNLLKKYNEKLELSHYTESQRTLSLKKIFNRDIVENNHFYFKGKPIFPTKKENGELPMEILFTHLTTSTSNNEIKHRDFDLERSIRLHWIKYHILEQKQNNMLVFSIKENGSIRTYIFDMDENYVIILELQRNNKAYYLLTAYFLEGKDKARDKIRKKYERRLNDTH